MYNTLADDTISPSKSTRFFGLDSQTLKQAHYITGISTNPSSEFDYSANDLLSFLSNLPRMAIQRSQRLSEVLDDIFEKCLTENWDDEGARPLTEELRRTVDKFLNELPPTISDPDISPEADGDLLLEWWYGPTEVLSLCISENHRLSFAGIIGDKEFDGKDYFGNELPESIRFALDQLTTYQNAL